MHNFHTEDSNLKELYIINDTLTELIINTLHYKFISDEIQDKIIDELTHHIANKIRLSH